MPPGGSGYGDEFLRPYLHGDRLCQEIPTHLVRAADALPPTARASDMPDHLVEAVTTWVAACRSALGH